MNPEAVFALSEQKKTSGLYLRLERCKSLQCSSNVTPNNKDVISQVATLRSGQCLNEV